MRRVIELIGGQEEFGLAQYRNWVGTFFYARKLGMLELCKLDIFSGTLIQQQTQFLAPI